MTFTEEATLCAVAGAEVFFIEGRDQLIKITTRTDVRVASFLLQADQDED